MQIEQFFSPGGTGGKARIAVFMSGSGTNAEALLEYERRGEPVAFETVLIVTDAPETSRARVLAGRCGLPLAELDIRAFYRERGETAIALTTPRRRRLREEWTEALRALVAPYRMDFAVLAGFVPLCNITRDYPCLNVHPGDLTVEENGRRILAGLHFKPVETAILKGFPALRSSVILAQPFEGKGEAEMDSGPVLGVSAPMAVGLEGCSVEQLAAVAAARRQAPYRDLLREVAAANLERLKFAGDHVVLPRVVDEFAAGRFGRRDGQLCYRKADCSWIPVRTVEYSAGKAEPVTV